ncbi:hypothetical protein LCGC14_0868780 [marine sediment metagenome]|uniref:LamG-like jellyroll fold domain-containing protein n=1 Tax=marine sediment metagenome TaxID=412755 RepID=A0A0F9PQX6_9ZZZZ
MKKLFILMFCMILLIGSVSAFSISDIDDVKDYDKNLKTYSLDNFFGFGKHIADLELKTPQEFKVPIGYQKVAEIEIKNGENDYENIINGIELYNIRDDMKEVVRDVDYKYKTIIQVPRYETICDKGFSENGTAINTNCRQKQIGLKDKVEWLDFTKNSLLKGENLTLGIFTDVKKGDYIEWVINVYGNEKLTAWAFWTASLDVNLISYYPLNETSGVVLDVHGSNNGTNNGATRGATGIIGNAFEFNGSTYVSSTYDFTSDFGNGDFTMSLWINQTTLGAGQRLLYQIHRTPNKGFYLSTNNSDGGEISLYLFGTSASTIHYTTSLNMVAGNWYNIVVRRTSGILTIDVNDNQELSEATSAGDLSDTGTFDPFYTAVSRDIASFFDGIMDEIGIWNRSLIDSEISDLWNDGSGLNYFIRNELPQITLNSPIDTFNSTSQTIDFNGSVVSIFGITNVTLSIDGILNETNSSGINDTDYLFTKTLSEGNHNWTYESCNINGCATATTRNFTIDTILPQINISYPDGQNFPYLVNLNNITLNTTITDTNLDTCWYEYNSTNTTFSCSSEVLSENNLTINNESIIIVWANDTLGQENSSTSDWTYDLFDFNNYTFDATITESSSITFIGNFQTGTTISSTFLEYNNTNYSVSIDSLGGNRYTLTSTLTSPSVSSDTNITWFFWVNNINATSQNQTVQNINLDDCSSYTNYIVNYTLVDELTQIEISNVNSSIESLIYLRTISGEIIEQFNETFTGDSTPTVCSEIQLNETGLRLWEQSRYGSDDYVFEQHNIQNATMTSLPNEITLRDLPSTSATTFRITYKSETFLPIPDAVISIQRKYIGEGVFKSIESPITDANGEVSASLDLEAVIYRIVVSENGITLSTFENPAVACDNILTGDCTININEKQTINLINNYDTINDFNFGITQDNRTITLTFEIPSGESKSVNLFVNQSTILGNKTSCNQTLLATSGQIQCDIDLSLGDVFTNIRISSDSVLITTASTIIYEDRSQYFGTDNIVLTFFLVLSLVLLFVSDAIMVLIGLIIGLIASSLMLFLNSGSVFGTTSVLMYLIVIIVILIIKISIRQNR